MKNQDLNLADVAYTLQTGRKKFNHRQVFVCRNIPELIMNPDSRSIVSAVPVETGKPDIVFMFPGQGSQYLNMGLGLYQHESFFRETIDKCSTILETFLGFDIKKIIFADDRGLENASDDLQKTCYNQPAIFVLEYALSKLLESWGIKPSFMVGHSIGEYVAATIAGVFELEDALEIVAARGRLMQDMPPGNMLSVYVSGEDILMRLPDSLSLAAVNAPSFSVVSGKTEDIEAFEQTLLQEGIKCRVLKTSHAFHSTMMEPVVEPFRKIIEKKSLSKPIVPFVSTSTGEWIRDDQATDPMYWANHLIRPVLFSKAIKTLEEKKCHLMLEVGPRSTLTFLVQEHYPIIKGKTVLPVLGATNQDQAEWISILNTVGQLWVSGVDLDWTRFYQNEIRRKCPLPGYWFDKQAFWIDPVYSRIEPFDSERGVENKQRIEKKLTTGPNCLEDRFPVLNADLEDILSGIWKNVLPDVQSVKHSDNFFELGGHSLLAVQFFSEIKRKTGIDLHLATLFEAPTFGALLDLLYREIQGGNGNIEKFPGEKESIENRTAWRALVSIKPQGTRLPFFCVHGVGGNVLNYVPLSVFVDDDQPFYGLQARGIDGVLEPFSSVEEMAKRYIEEIKQIQPHGPYFLGGGSMGGMIAYEMAQQMLQAGEKIGLLAMFDTYGPKRTDVFFQRSNDKRNGYFFGKMYLYFEKIRHKPFNEQFLTIKKSFQFHLKDRMKMIAVKLFRLMEKPLPHTLRYWYVEKKNISVSRIYRAQKYKGRMLLFRAIGEKCLEEYDPNNGWAGMAEDGIEIIEIPGNHENIVEHPLLGECLAASLKKIQGSSVVN
jgi:malonyl CoA-acyl carrier protein transacylase/thioesterase domain-containing protein/aryl carrier-like protein